MTNTPTDPQAEYQTRLAARRAEADRLGRTLDRLGRARVAVFALGAVAAAGGYFGGWFAPWWALLAVVPFAGLAIRYDVLGKRLAWAERAARFYEQGLDRLAGKWPGRGEDGSRFLDPRHPFAADLDLFGPGSLFQRLNTARTQDGEAVLAGWLLRPAAAEEVAARQAAVADLRPRLDLRESLALAGGDLQDGANFRPLAAWGQTPLPPTPAWLYAVVTALGWVNVALALGWIFLGFTSAPMLAGVLVALAASAAWLPPRAASLRVIDQFESNLPLLQTVLARLEREPFAAPKLRELQDSLRSAGVLPSLQIAALRNLADWYSARRDVLFLPIRLLRAWDLLMALRFDRWRHRSGPAVERWLAAVAELEAFSSLAAYSFESPTDPFPDIVPGPARFAGEALAHPLLPTDAAVRNDVRLGDGLRVLVVSGSNMSGKSTLLRAVGANAVLALAGGPVRAASLTLSPLAVGATMRVQDSLAEGRSRFLAEVSRVRDILARAEAGGPPVLFLLDELFAGTNSADRQRGAEGVIRKLADFGAVGLVSTHDLALTDIAARLGDRAANVHFADQVGPAGELTFDYRMRSGVVPHGNGLALMRAVGLEV